MASKTVPSDHAAREEIALDAAGEIEEARHV
jgi:hypothetical protein